MFLYILKNLIIRIKAFCIVLAFLGNEKYIFFFFRARLKILADCIKNWLFTVFSLERCN